MNTNTMHTNYSHWSCFHFGDAVCGTNVLCVEVFLHVVIAKECKKHKRHSLDAYWSISYILFFILSSVVFCFLLSVFCIGTFCIQIAAFARHYVCIKEKQIHFPDFFLKNSPLCLHNSF